ncbi:MAG TPA: serine O-acetyltransferase [Nitrospiria bacterium]|jgi:serine O-acetyltransferase
MFPTIRRDLQAVFDRDPAANNLLEVLINYSGFHAILWHRLTHKLWLYKIPFLPRLLSQVVRLFTGIEIHPGAKIGPGFFIDHGMGVVIGETSEIGEDVTLFQGVTLGGTGKEKGKRHPSLGNRVVVGAGAKVLGGITVGDNVKIGANSVVLRSVPSDSTVVGIPGRIIRGPASSRPSVQLNHTDLPDPVMEQLEYMAHEIEDLRGQVERIKKEMEGGK